MPADATIYDQIWEADNNKLSTSIRNDQGEWVDSSAEILLDHQVRASGQRNIDLATRPLFSSVNSTKLNGPTYQAYKALLDNYLVNYRDPEDYTEAEIEEDYNFLNLAVSSPSFRVAYDYITNQLGKRISEEEFVDQLWKIWFEPYTNYFDRNNPIEFASGFEHVFIGEGKYRQGEGIQRGNVSGYHDWYKFYIDESHGRVDFRGTKYDLRGQSEPRNPYVVTLQLVWNLMDTDGNVVAELFKSKGGFFVGISPECQMALGTVAYYESLQGITINDRRRVQIQGSNFDLVLYRETLQNGDRGPHIRSFFPIYFGDSSSPEPTPGPVIVQPISSDTDINDGAVIIIRTMPNPPGDDATGEWVVIKNTTAAAIDLTGWQMTDKLGRSQALTGVLPANAEQQFNVERSQPSGMMLGNSGGRIQVINSEGDIIASVSYGRARESQVMQF